MNIYLSINNREEEIQIPVLPSSFGVSSEYSNTRTETVTHEEIMDIGNKRLSSISFSSFFPINDYPFLKSRNMWGWEYITTIGRWRAKKIPIRLIITETNINVPVVITNFEYSVQDGTGDIYYSLGLEEYKFVDIKQLTAVPIAKPKPVIVEEPKKTTTTKKSPTSGKYSTSTSTTVKEQATKNTSLAKEKSTTKSITSLDERQKQLEMLAADKQAGGNSGKSKSNELQNNLLQKQMYDQINSMAKKANDEDRARYNLNAEESKRYDEYDSRGAFYPTWAN